MASKVVLLALLSCIALYGATAKSTAGGLERELDEILQELREDDNKADTGDDTRTAKKSLNTEEKVQSNSKSETKVAEVRELDEDLETLEEDIRNLIATAENGNNEEEKRTSQSKRIFEGINGLEDIGNIGETLLQEAVDEAALYAKHVLEEDEAQKLFYYQRGANIVSFATNTDDVPLSEHGYILDDRTYIIFEVRACSDASVDLLTETAGTYYEIHIGGNVNAEVSISKTQDSNKQLEETVAKSTLDCSRYSRFLISWAKGHIQVLYEDESENGEGWASLVSWTDSDSPLVITDISVTTAPGIEGHWRTVILGPPTEHKTSVTTGTDSDYTFDLLQNEPFNFPLVQEPYIVFEVKACSTVRLGLKKDDSDDPKLWEIAFDADHNGVNETQIRRFIGGSRKGRETITVLDCANFKRFMVSWRNNRIEVFHEVSGEWVSIIDWYDTKGGREVAFIGLYGDAEWRFYDDHETPIDVEAGGDTSETMAGLNDLEPNLTELEIEEERAIFAIFALKFLLKNSPFNSVEELKQINGFSKVFEEAQVKNDKKACKEESVKCTNSIKKSPFRSIDGTCNNLRYPTRGATGTAQHRLLPAAYDDGVNDPKKTGVNGNKLPSARHVSNIVMRNESDAETPDDPTRTVMMAIFGQFVDHDITETPQSKGHRESVVSCCAITDELIRNQRIQCNTIDIDPNDPDYSHTCMGLKRSLATRGEHVCEPDVRQQMNDITSYVDGSQIYGSTEEVAERLRTHSDGKLLVENNDLLPKNNNNTCVLDDPDNNHCFLAGDVRVNENPQLMALHTAFVRYHNILCDRLLDEGLTDDQQIYDISRKIIGAILQNTLYGQWLPSVIGEDLMEEYGLTVGSAFTYDDTEDPTIINSFAAAAFRYGHTLVSGLLTTMDGSFQRQHEARLKDSFFNTSLAFIGISEIARTMSLFRCKHSDAFLVEDLKTHLFETATSHGMDLTALNIQRGRDHGLPSYVDFYAALTGQPKPQDFSDLSNHTADAQVKLASVYADVRDMDLFAGAMTETNIDGAHLGPTFANLIAEQFRRLKFGDRFFYETTGKEGFNQEQLEDIKSMSFAKVLCEAFALEVIQPNVFNLPTAEDLHDCGSYPDIDVSLFKNIV